MNKSKKSPKEPTQEKKEQKKAHHRRHHHHAHKRNEPQGESTTKNKATNLTDTGDNIDLRSKSKDELLLEIAKLKASLGEKPTIPPPPSPVVPKSSPIDEKERYGNLFAIVCVQLRILYFV